MVFVNDHTAVQINNAELTKASGFVTALYPTYLAETFATGTKSYWKGRMRTRSFVSSIVISAPFSIMDSY